MSTECFWERGASHLHAPSSLITHHSVLIACFSIYDSRIQFRSATSCCLKNTSFGVLKPRVLRGRLFSRAATRCTSSCVILAKSYFLGKYCLINPFVFSFRPRSQLQ